MSVLKSTKRAPSTEARERGRLAAIQSRRGWATQLRSDVWHHGLKPFHPDDRNNWDRLAAAAGVRLPPYGIPCMTNRIERWLQKLGISVAEYLDDVGYYTPSHRRGLKDWPEHNPTWPLKAWVGLQLDYLERTGRITLATDRCDQAAALGDRAG